MLSTHEIPVPASIQLRSSNSLTHHTPQRHAQAIKSWFQAHNTIHVTRAHHTRYLKSQLLLSTTRTQSAPRRRRRKEEEETAKLFYRFALPPTSLCSSLPAYRTTSVHHTTQPAPQAIRILRSFRRPSTMHAHMPPLAQASRLRYKQVLSRSLSRFLSHARALSLCHEV